MNEQKTTLKQKLDGWVNILTGLGLKKKDASASTRYGACMILDQVSLADIYRGEGIGRKVIDQVADDMWREGFRVEGDTQRRQH